MRFEYFASLLRLIIPRQSHCELQMFHDFLTADQVASQLRDRQLENRETFEAHRAHAHYYYETITHLLLSPKLPI